MFIHLCLNKGKKTKESAFISVAWHRKRNILEGAGEHDTHCRNANWQWPRDQRRNNHRCRQTLPLGFELARGNVWCRSAAKRHPPWAFLSTSHCSAWRREWWARSETPWWHVRPRAEKRPKARGWKMCRCCVARERDSHKGLPPERVFLKPMGPKVATKKQPGCFRKPNWSRKIDIKT